MRSGDLEAAILCVCLVCVKLTQLKITFLLNKSLRKQEGFDLINLMEFIFGY